MNDASRPRAVAGIQARLSSTRLPGKVLADVVGVPLIERVVERVRASRRVDEVVVLTSVEPSDDPLVEFLEQRGVAYRRGPLDDVLARYIALVDELEPDHVVRVTGDCPLVEPRFIDRQLEALAAFDGDLLWIAPGGFDGTLGGQGAFSARALRAAARSDDPRDREHCGSFYFRREDTGLRFVELVVGDELRREGLRLTVDEPADLRLVRRIFEAFEGRAMDLEQVLTWLDEHPEVAALNATVEDSSDNRACRRLDAALAPPTVGTWK